MSQSAMSSVIPIKLISSDVESVSTLSKLLKAKSCLQSEKTIAVIATEKCVNSQFIPKLVKWVSENKLILVIPHVVNDLVTKKAQKFNTEASWKLLFDTINAEIAKPKHTIILQDSLESSTVEESYETMKEICLKLDSAKLFVLGSMKDYLKIPTIDIYSLEQLVK
eukprot:NODE_9_length_64580_cov_1.431941.p43 type:complete len:166 gc:universal NODE_9_length_64580_cov_1.431941:2116-2613(+)